MKKLRLNFPQWQGAGAEVVEQLVTELPLAQSRRGYVLGAQLLGFLSPQHQGVVRAVPVSMDLNTPSENGIAAYQAVKSQLQAALDTIDEEQPDRIITLGGDCAVSIAPFTYLADKYADDTAIIWLDAHPDLGVPGDEYTGFHAMALAQTLGLAIRQSARCCPHTKSVLNMHSSSVCAILATPRNSAAKIGALKACRAKKSIEAQRQYCNGCKKAVNPKC